ncbi:MAG: hypothetical protein ACRC46_13840 [Thermoguttaceae bacterium]
MTYTITLHPGLSLRTKLSITSATLLLGLLGGVCGSVFDKHDSPSATEEEDDTVCQIERHLFSVPSAPTPSISLVKHNPTTITPPPTLAMSLEVAPLGKYAQVYTPPTMEVHSSLEQPFATPADLPPIPQVVESQTFVESATIEAEPANTANSLASQVPVTVVEVAPIAPAVSTPVVQKTMRPETVSLFGPLRVDGRLFTIETLDKIPAEPPVVPPSVVPKEFTPPPTLPEHLTALKPVRDNGAVAPKVVPPPKTAVPPKTPHEVTPRSTSSRTAQTTTTQTTTTTSLVPVSKLAQQAAVDSGSESFVPIRHLPLRGMGE